MIKTNRNKNLDSQHKSTKSKTFLTSSNDNYKLKKTNYLDTLFNLLNKKLYLLLTPTIN